MADVRFSALPGFRVVDFDSEVIVFNPRSWEAHLLNQAAEIVLQFLSESPHSKLEVAAVLADLLDESERASASAHAERVLNDLRAVGLVVRIGEDRLASR